MEQDPEDDQKFVMTDSVFSISTVIKVQEIFGTAV